MPLIRIERVSENRSIALWKITEDYKWLVGELCPVSTDLAVIERYRSEQKKLEWLTGRLTVKKLAEKVKLPYQGISKSEHGKPLLKGSSAEISLTHSYPYVAAILDGSDEVGIDLEQPTEKLRRISHKFLNHTEKQFVGDNLEKLCVCWCTKESLYKLHSKKGLLFSEQIHLDPFDLAREGIISGSIIANGTKKSYKLRYEVHTDFVLTFTI